MASKKQAPKKKLAPKAAAAPAKVAKKTWRKPAEAVRPAPKATKSVVAAGEAVNPPINDVRLTPKQESFCLAYLTTGNASEAYREAYNPPTMKPESIRVEAAKMLALPNIALRIRQVKAKTADIAVMTAADVLKEAMRLARFDVRKLYGPDGSPIPIHELDDETAAAVQAVDVLEEFKGTGEDRVFVGYTKKYKVADKNAALEKLFKHFGLYEIDNRQKADPLAELFEKIWGTPDAKLPIARR